MRLCIVFLISTFFISFSSKHPLHVSVCEMEYKPEKKSMQITWRVFTDDFEKGLKLEDRQAIQLTNVEHKNKADALISKYLLTHFSFRTDGKPRTWQYVGYECENEMMFIYLETSHLASFKKASIHCTFLIDEFEDQSNLIHLTKGSLKSLRLSKNNIDGLLQF